MGMGNQHLDYFLFVFVASLGVLQIAAAYAQLRGLLFFDRSIIGYILGFAAFVIAFWWFFTTDKRVGHDIIAGSQQLWLFLSAAAAAFLVTATIASIIKSRKLTYGETEEVGLKSLQNMTYFQAIARYFRRISKR